MIFTSPSSATGSRLVLAPISASASSKRVEVARLIQVAETQSAYHRERTRRVARLHHIEPELAGIEALAPAEGEQLNAVFVVADEQAGRAVRPREVLGRDAQAPPRKMPEHAEERRHHGHPFGQLVLGHPPFPIDDHVRVDADRGIVDEGLAVDLGEVDDTRAASGDGCRRFLDRQGDAEVLGEMVERAERQHAERHDCSGQHACSGAHAAVAPANDDGIDIAASALARQRARRRRAALRHRQNGFRPRRHAARKRLPSVLLDLGGKRLVEGAGAGIHQRDDPFHRDRLRPLGEQGRLPELLPWA